MSIPINIRLAIPIVRNDGAKTHHKLGFIDVQFATSAVLKRHEDDRYKQLEPQLQQALRDKYGHPWFIEDRPVFCPLDPFSADMKVSVHVAVPERGLYLGESEEDVTSSDWPEDEQMDDEEHMKEKRLYTLF